MYANTQNALLRFFTTIVSKPAAILLLSTLPVFFKNVKYFGIVIMGGHG